MKEYSEYTDEELLKLLKEDKKLSGKAFYVIYERYNVLLTKFCLYFADTIQEGRELVQDTWIDFYYSVTKNCTPAKVLSYLISTARHIYLDKIKRNAKDREVMLENVDNKQLEQIAVYYEFETNSEKSELMSIIEVTLKNMKADQREAFVLHWFNEFTFKEIAEMLEESVSCIKMRCSRAMDEIKAATKNKLTKINKVIEK